MIPMILAVFLVVLLFYVAALYESVALAILAVFFMGLILAAYVLIIWRLLSLQVKIAIPMTLAESGQPVSVHFSMQAKRRLFGNTRLRVQVEGRQLPGKKVLRTWMTMHAPATGTATVRKEVTMHCAGGYVYRLRRVRVYDWTGWFYLTKQMDETAMTQLLPMVHELPVQLSGAVRDFFGEAEVYDDLRGGYDSSQVFQIRPYVPGDRLQNIHWKLSAKSQELMVREHSLPKGCGIVLLLGTKGLDRQDPVQRDLFLQIAASVSFSLVDVQCPHIVCWYDDATEDLVRMCVDDEEAFYEWQLRYLVARTKGQHVDVQERYTKKYANEPCLHRICVEPGLELYLDGKRWHAFAKKGSLEKELGNLRLYL